MDELFRLSLALTAWLQAHYPQLLGVMAAFTSLGEELAYLTVLPAVYWSVDKRLGRQLGYIFLLSVAVNNTAKNLLRQPRPFWLDASVQRWPVEGYGLPSGHAQNATAVYLLVAAWLRRGWVWLLAFAGIFLISLSRIYLGVHFLQDVRGEEDGLLLADALERGADFADLVGVEAVGRLVEHQQVRLVQQSARQGHALAETAGELGDSLAPHPVQVADAAHGVHALLEALARHAPGAREEGEHVLGGHVEVEGAVLGQVADLLGGGDAVAKHVNACDLNLACRGRQEAGQHAHGRGLARAVGPQKTHDLALRDAERDVVNGHRGAVALGEVLYLDDQGCCASISLLDGRPPMRAP